MIETIEEEIELERERRMVLIKKYNKGCTVIDVAQHGIVIGMIGFGATSLGAMLTAVGIPIALAMDVGAVTAGILSIANSRLGKYMKAKMNKHEKIKTLAETKLCTISSYVSKAMEDEVISDNEYSVILTEYKDFNTQKDAIRLNTKQAIEEHKNVGLSDTETGTVYNN